MIDIETWAEARRLFYVEHQTINAITNALGIHHSTVKRAIGAERFVNHTILRKNADLERFNSVILDTLERVPRVRATRLLELLKERGFSGSVYQVRRYLRKVRPQRPSRVFTKLSFVAGEQAQCDWASCGKISVGNSTRLLSLFVMVLSYSRRIYARFTLDQTFESFAREHVRAFEDFCGVPRVVMYDNLKAAVIERIGRAIHFSPQLVEISGYYHFRIEAAAVANPQTKGRVERAIGYVRTSFLSGREFKDIESANQQLHAWLKDVANTRPWPQDRSRTVDAVFSEERSQLIVLPEHPIEIWITKSVRAVRLPFIRFDTNDYEIPGEYVGRSLTLQASDELVRILDADKELTRYKRTFSKSKTLTLDPGENNTNIVSSIRKKHHLIAIIPEVDKLCEQLVRINEPIRGHLAKLYELISQYGTLKVSDAIRQALLRNTPRSESVAQILSSSNQLPIVPILLPDRDGIKNIVVKQHDLSHYDHIYSKQHSDKREVNEEATKANNTTK